MKKILTILSLALLVSACGQIKDSEPVFNVTGLESAYVFAADLGQQRTFEIVSDNVLWEIDSDAEWLTISPMRSLGGYETVTITPDDNNSAEARSCTFTLKAENGYTSTVSVTQKGLE